MVKIVEVKTKKEQREFINFPLKLYAKNQYFVPYLYSDELKMFKSDYTYYDQAESVFYLAYKDNKVVGRIQGILQRVANEKWNQKRVRFNRIDFIDDEEVSKALFEAVENWAREKKMEEVVGPLGFSDLDREGLLVEGFDQKQTFEEQYNYPYYQRHIEKLGYVKEVGWTERKIKAPKEIDPRLEKISKRMMDKYKLSFAKCKSTSEFIKKYGDAFFEILDKTYDNIYGTVPFTDRMKKMMITNFKLIIDLKYVAVIIDETGKVVCFGICFPSIADAVRKCKGHFTPLGLIRLLYAIKRPRVIDMGLIGVLPEYEMKGIASAIISEVMKMLSNGKIEYAETNLNLEDNYSIQNQWKSFDNEITKRRISYKKSI